MKDFYIRLWYKGISMSQNALSCDQTVIIPQLVGTCWFNALLMCVFYSEAMRDVCIAYRQRWGAGMPNNQFTRELISIFDQIIRLYKRPGGDDNGFYDKISPEKILYLFHAANPTFFEYAGVKITPAGRYVIRDGWGKGGYKPELYAMKVLQFLGIPCITLDANKLKAGGFRLSLGNVHSRTKVIAGRNKKRVFSYRVKPKEEVERIIRSSPAVIIVDIGKKNDWKRKTKAKKPSYYYFGGRYTNIPHSIRFGRHRYILDTVQLANVNMGDRVMTKNGVKKVSGHSIAGLTCNGRRYIYSGWITKTKNTARGSNTNNLRVSDTPCPLMPFDWATDRRSFFIAKPSKSCQVQFTPPKPESVRFNSVVGSRSHFYVRADLVKYKTKMLQRIGSVKGIDKLRVGSQLIRKVVNNVQTTSIKINKKPPLKKHKRKIPPHIAQRQPPAGPREGAARRNSRRVLPIRKMKF